MNGYGIFAGSSGAAFASRICDYLRINLGLCDSFRFTEGNTFVRVRETVRARDVYVIIPIALRPNDEFVELLFWADAFKRASANSVTAVIPYFSYAKGDKKDEPRVSIRARVCAESMELAGVDRVVAMDLHSPQIQGFFKKPVDHLFAMPVLAERVRRLGLDDIVVVSPDSGSAKRAREWAAQLGNCAVAIGDKIREGHEESSCINCIIGEVKDRDAVIVDDFTITGGTLISMAEALKARGARRVVACLSHAPCSETTVRRIEKSALELVLTTDSIDNPAVRDSKSFVVASVAPLFAEAIRRIAARESVSALFEEAPPEDPPR